MAIHPGRHQFGTDRGRITLRTSRDGLAASAGHDLTIDAVRWTGELVVEQDLAPSALTVTIDLGALVVRDGTGGIKPLSDRDKREIAVSARKVLGADRYPQATFTATGFEPDASGTGGTITGTLALAGKSGPQRLAVSQPEPGHYRATTTIRQTGYGIKPYSAFLGSLRVADAVEVEADIDLSADADQGQGS
jgi:polyisoprenoid-binding protein YceI